MHDLQQELLDLLQRNLPATQVGIIKDRLEQADLLEKEVSKLKEELKSQNRYTSQIYDERGKLEQKVKDLEGKIAQTQLREADLEIREKMCHAKELNWGIIERDIRLEAAGRIVENMFNLTSQVFHSPVFQTQHTGHMAVATQHGTILQPFDMMTRTEAKVPTEHYHNPGSGSNLPTGGVANY